MNDLKKAEEDLYSLLKKKNLTYSDGRFSRENTLIEEYHIPKAAIIEAHNKGTVIDVYASGFHERPDLSDINKAERRFGPQTQGKGYTLVDLPVPLKVLYGQISLDSKKDVSLELINTLYTQIKRDWCQPPSNARKKNLSDYSPKDRIGNARAVIEGADLNNSLTEKYLKQKTELEACIPVADKILSGIANGRWMLTNAGESALSDEDFKTLFAGYSGPEVEVYFKQLDKISENLDDIKRYRELLQDHKLQKNDIEAILGVSLESLPEKWTKIE